MTEAQFDEAAGKKDACYHKVKARYDVWPSAYASGALVKCRKAGAANWGNSKKEGVNEVSVGVNVHYFYKKANKNKNKFFKMLSDFRKKHSDTKWIKMLNYALEDFNENPKKYKTIDDKQNILFKNLQNNKKVNEVDTPMYKITYQDSTGRKKTDIMRAKNSNLAKRDFSASNKGRGFKILKVVKEGTTQKFKSAVIDKAVKIAKSMGGNMTAAVKKIEKIEKNLSKNGRVEYALQQANEGLNEKVSQVFMMTKAFDAILKKQTRGKKPTLKDLERVYTIMRGRYKDSQFDNPHMAESVIEGLGDIMSKKLKKLKGVNLKKKKSKLKLKLKGRGVYQDYDGLDDSIHFESITENGMTTNHIYYEEDGKGYGYTLEFVNDLNEAEYQGRKVKLGKIMQGDAKKFKVYVKNPKGNVVKVNFGQGGDAKGGTMKIRKSNPGARKSFRARHNCDNPGPRHKARYWSCRKW